MPPFENMIIYFVSAVNKRRRLSFETGATDMTSADIDFIAQRNRADEPYS